MFKVILKTVLASLVIGITIAACTRDNTTKNSTPIVSSAEQLCMDKHRWDTIAVNTSRLAAQIHYNRIGKGELAKYVSDYDAVKILYCSGN